MGGATFVSRPHEIKPLFRRFVSKLHTHHMCVWFGDHIFYPNPTPKKHISCASRCTEGLTHLYALCMPQVEELKSSTSTVRTVVKGLSSSHQTCTSTVRVPVRTRTVPTLLVLYKYPPYLCCTHHTHHPTRTPPSLRLLVFPLYS